MVRLAHLSEQRQSRAEARYPAALVTGVPQIIEVRHVQPLPDQQSTRHAGTPFSPGQAVRLEAEPGRVLEGVMPTRIARLGTDVRSWRVGL